MNRLTKLQTEIANSLNLEYDPLKISIVDSIKILDDCFNKKIMFSILKKYKNNNELSDIDKYIVDKILDPFYLEYLSIQQTYFDNLLFGVYFILNNPFLFSSYQMKSIYENLKIITLIPYLIRKSLQSCYDSDNLKYFFNEYLFTRWLESFDFKKITYDKYISIVGLESSSKKYYDMYSEIWIIFEKIVDETKIIVNEFYQKYKGLKHVPGCSNISKQFYLYCVETNVGLSINSLENLLQWGIKEYKKVREIMKQTIINLEPDLKDKSFGDMIKTIHSMKKYKYSSKEEYIKDHKNNIKKYRDFFVDQKKLPLLHEPMLVDFDEEKMAGGYWFLDTFYLNTNRWDDTNRFDTSALVLHETIPGHHMQLSYEIHNNNINSLILWFPIYTNGYTEGWGLFSEKLGHDLDDFNYLGVLSFHMFRTLRIIADISIHLYGIDPEEIITFFANNLPMPIESIRSEIYRYVSLPGQALCYKIGDELIKRLFVDKFNRTNKLLQDDAIKLYNEIIKDGTMPLDVFVKKYNINSIF
jgi:hypothetical protein